MVLRDIISIILIKIATGIPVASNYNTGFFVTFDNVINGCIERWVILIRSIGTPYDKRVIGKVNFYDTVITINIFKATS